MTESENYCTYVCSRGLLKACNIHDGSPNSSSSNINYLNPTSVKENDTLYICNKAIRNFVENFFQQITKPFILISGDSDETIFHEVISTDLFDKIVNSPLLIHWFSQNCVISHPKITRMPIGLDYHTVANNNYWWNNNIRLSPKGQENELIDLQNNSKPFWERIPKVYSDCHFRYDRFGDRKTAIEKISAQPNQLLVMQQSLMIRMDTWKQFAQHAFVLSPHGNGLDCHRTWETLILGSIPVMRTSGLDSLFSELPVLIVKEWEDVNEELLLKTINEFRSKQFNYSKLKLQYWLDLINLKKNINSLNMVWESNDKHNYDIHINNNIGQITLNNRIGQFLFKCVQDDNLKTFLEIGTWNGLGSTKCIIDGLKLRKSDYVFYSLECNFEKCGDAQKYYLNIPNVHILNEVLFNDIPPNLYDIFPQLITNKTFEHWNHIDLENMRDKPLFLNRPDLPIMFDMILLDGGEFTTYFEYQMIKDRCKILLLDDSNVDKCKKIVDDILSQPNKWKVIFNDNERNGTFGCVRIDLAK